MLLGGVGELFGEVACEFVLGDVKVVLGAAAAEAGVRGLELDAVSDQDE